MAICERCRLKPGLRTGFTQRFRIPFGSQCATVVTPPIRRVLPILPEHERLGTGGNSADDPVVVVCDTGERSAEVAARLRDQGYRAANVKGGMKGWSGDKLPLQPAEDEEFHGPRRPGPLGA